MSHLIYKNFPDDTHAFAVKAALALVENYVSSVHKDAVIF